MFVERLIVVVGVSGSGKSTALNAIEDKGFYCVENIPAPLITSVVNSLVRGTSAGVETLGKAQTRFALLVDARDEQVFDYVEQALIKLREAGTKVEVLFLDCDDETVLRRFRETRRPHPFLLMGNSIQTLTEAINKERNLISRFREIADRVIDTSSYSPHQLRRVVENYIGAEEDQLEVSVQSFGFKYGVPQDSDLVVDVRFLPNPYFVPSMREHTGENDDVYEYVMNSADTAPFLELYLGLLRFLLPRYKNEGKRYFTISIGCTGGQHRSVALARRINTELNKSGFKASCRHRDVSRASA